MWVLVMGDDFLVQSIFAVRESGSGASLKFCPPHLTAACDSKADSGKLSNDVFIGPKTRARSNGRILDWLD
jgi:hypothetical protein